LYGLANYQNVSATILGGPFYQDRIRSLTLGANYNVSDRLQGYNTLGFDFAQGFNIWGANQHYYQSRPEGHSDFSLMNLTASRIQPLSQHFSIYAAMQGQYSFNPLLATEQFGFGGPSFGRGYDPYAISGDRGLAGKVELRIQTEPNLRFLRAVQLYTFYDAGIIWNIDNINLPGKQDATSVGLGARMSFIKNLEGELFIGKPLTFPVFTLVSMHQNGKQARVFFQLIARV
jgi:hemolysin activation/secretion protein